MTNKQLNAYNRVISLENQKPAKLRGFEVNDRKSLETALNKMEEILDGVAGKEDSINYRSIPDAIIREYEKIEAEVGDTLARMPENEAKPYKERLKKISSKMTRDEASGEGIKLDEDYERGYLGERRKS